MRPLRRTPLSANAVTHRRARAPVPVRSRAGGRARQGGCEAQARVRGVCTGVCARARVCARATAGACWLSAAVPGGSLHNLIRRVVMSRCGCGTGGRPVPVQMWHRGEPSGRTCAKLLRRMVSQEVHEVFDLEQLLADRLHHRLSPLPHRRAGTGSAPATSAPGLVSPLTHPHRDLVRLCHICAGTGLFISEQRSRTALWAHPQP